MSVKLISIAKDGEFGSSLGEYLKILFISVEVAPYAKVGGLADVAGSLPNALKSFGHDVKVAMPGYRMIESDPAYKCKSVRKDLLVQINDTWEKHAWVKQTMNGDVPVLLIGTDEWFSEADRSERIYLPGVDQYLFFSRAVLEALKSLDWIPDVIHCNDWHTGLIPVLMRETRDVTWARVASVFTVHNLAYQGEFGPAVLDRAGLSQDLFTFDKLETYGMVNFLKAGCTYADQVNTVSPTYAKEIQTAEFGCRLEGLMRYLDEQGRLNGILNGIDTDVFNPETDPAQPAHFSAQAPGQKQACRESLLKELKMKPIKGAPLMGVVSRLSSQKGMDLMIDAAAEMFAMPTQLVVQGLGDPSLAEAYRELQKRFPNHVRFVERFDADLAQRVYGGSDMFLMPSSFEPCGLGQMIALRYGTIPVVRKTGGLADTVFEGKNGFTFARRTASDFLSALSRAHSAFQLKEKWNKLLIKALSGDYSWGPSALEYEEMYRRARAGREESHGEQQVIAGCK
jgi:starch synthase